MESMERKEEIAKGGSATGRLLNRGSLKDLEQNTVLVNGVMKKYSEVTPEDQMAMKEEDFLVFFYYHSLQNQLTIGIL